MTTTSINTRSGFAAGINLFELPAERRRALLETLHAINLVILRERLPMIVASNFHVGIESPVVINYNQYTDRKLGQVLRNVPDAAPLMKRTHDLSDRHEIRWYQVEDVVASAGEVEISSDSDAVAAIGIFTVTPGKQDALLAALKGYAEEISGATGFLGFATHRGHNPEHVASYERWQSAEAYKKNSGDLAPRIRGLADETKLHLYEVVEVARFDLQQVAAGT